MCEAKLRTYRMGAIVSLSVAGEDKIDLKDRRVSI